MPEISSLVNKISDETGEACLIIVHLREHTALFLTKFHSFSHVTGRSSRARVEKLLLNIKVRIDPLPVRVARVEPDNPELLLQGSVGLTLGLELVLGHGASDADQVPREQVWIQLGDILIELVEVLEGGVDDRRRDAEGIGLSSDKNVWKKGNGRLKKVEVTEDLSFLMIPAFAEPCYELHMLFLPQAALI